MWVGLNPKVISPGAKEALSEIDCVFIYDDSYLAGFKALGCRHAEVVPLGVDVEQFDIVTPSQLEKDVAFIGMLEETRMRYLNAIHDLRLGIWSWNFDAVNAPLLEKCYCGQAAGDEAIACLKAAKIGINVHRDFEVAGGNFRLFEIPACGVLQIVDARKGIDKYFEPGKEVVLFDGENDLRQKVLYYLSHEEERLGIASAGWARARKEHNLSERFTQMMRCLDSLGAGRE
jgi:spore maturation protein CgeB